MSQYEYDFQDYNYNNIFSDYEKLLAKYNGMFEWLQGRHDLTWKPSKEIKRLYEESLSEIQTSKKE